MLLLRERELQLIRDIPEEIKSLAVHGDQARIQQVLADFLLNMVRCAPSSEGWIEIHVRPSLKQISEGLTLVRAEFRYSNICTPFGYVIPHEHHVFSLSCIQILFVVFFDLNLW